MEAEIYDNVFCELKIHCDSFNIYTSGSNINEGSPQTRDVGVTINNNNKNGGDILSLGDMAGREKDFA
jgi:hypothetical protein